MHEIPSLNYKYSDLEPYIDEETMRVHHTKHHQAYVDKLNAALEPFPDLAQEPIENLLRDLSKVPETIRQTVINNGGGHYNHSLFWQVIGPAAVSGEPREQTITALDQFFGGAEGFKEKFLAAATGHFGSGWAWLAVRDGRLEIMSTANQDSPLSQGWRPVLALDVWEHAYYLKYQNRRPEYAEAFFKVINWGAVEEKLVSALAGK